MIVCVCNSLSDRDLKSACHQCPNSSDPEHIMSRLDCKPSCGQCLCIIEEMMDQQARAA